MTIPRNRHLPKLALGIHEAMEAIGVGRNTMLELVHSGAIRHVRAGRRILIPVSALEAYLEEHAVSGAQE